MNPIIEIRDLTKTFGQITAVDRLNLTVNEGEIFGFIGPNGAGKTTTIRILTTLSKPTSGEAFIGGYSIKSDPYQVRNLIGYMPDIFGIYPNLSIQEYLAFFAGCFKIHPEKQSSLIDELIALVDLDHRRTDPVEKLSRGLKQRLSLARMLIHDPAILILDEPASGLDPRARVEIRELLRELSAMGKTIFFSSHILSDVADISTRVGIIETGNLIADGTPEEFHQLLGKTKIIRLGTISELLEVNKILENIPEIVAIHPQNVKDPPYIIHIEFDGNLTNLSEFLEILVQQKIKVTHFSETTSDLEEIYLRTTRASLT